MISAQLSPPSNLSLFSEKNGVFEGIPGVLNNPWPYLYLKWPLKTGKIVLVAGCFDRVFSCDLFDQRFLC